MGPANKITFAYYDVTRMSLMTYATEMVTHKSCILVFTAPLRWVQNGYFANSNSVHFKETLIVHSIVSRLTHKC